MPSTLQAVKLNSEQAVARRSESQTSPLALWHLLSLDAPTVATLWTWFLARCTHTPLSPVVPIAMFLAVWLLYATDRLLDTRRTTQRQSSAKREQLELRHVFHHSHRPAFTRIIQLVALALCPLILLLPRAILLRYLGLAALLILWFVLIHTLSKTHPQSLPKEFAVGPFFAAAVSIPSLSAISTPLLAAASLFALLCIQNCLYIHAWEHSSQPASAHITTQLGVRRLGVIAAICTSFALALIPTARETAPIFLAIALASALLFALHHTRNSFDRTDLRAAADLVLLTPLLVAPFLR